MARLTRKLRTAEAELETKRSQAQRQAANTQKLQEQVEEITAGASLLKQIRLRPAALTRRQLLVPAHPLMKTTQYDVPATVAGTGGRLISHSRGP